MRTNNGAPAESPPSAVAHNARALTSHIIGLVELQSQLLIADARDGARSALAPLGTLAAGGIVALSGLPMLLLSLAYGLVHAGLSTWLAMLLSGIAGMLVGASLMLAGWKSLKPRLGIWRRSAAELEENVRWIKAALSSRPHPEVEVREW